MLAQVVDEGLVHRLGGHACRRNAGEAVQLLAAEGLCVFDCATDTVLKLANPRRIAGNAALTRVPVACGQVVQHQRKPAAIQSLRDRVLVEGIGKLEFDPFKSRIGSSLEAVEKIVLVEQQGDVGGEPGHGLVISFKHVRG